MLDMQPEPLAQWSEDKVGGRVLNAWKDLAIRFVGGVSVADVKKHDGRYRITTVCGQIFDADQIVAAIGLTTPGRLAQSAGLVWQNGIDVDPTSMRTSEDSIYAIGDCITVNGQASRFIEPISRQAKSIAAAIVGSIPVPYEIRPSMVRLKTTSIPLTLY